MFGGIHVLVFPPINRVETDSIKIVVYITFEHVRIEDSNRFSPIISTRSGRWWIHGNTIETWWLKLMMKRNEMESFEIVSDWKNFSKYTHIFDIFQLLILLLHKFSSSTYIKWNKIYLWYNQLDLRSSIQQWLYVLTSPVIVLVETVFMKISLWRWNLNRLWLETWQHSLGSRCGWEWEDHMFELDKCEEWMDILDRL